MNKLLLNHTFNKKQNLFKMKTNILKISRINFCYKYVPSKILKFEDISFHEPVCKIYEKKENVRKFPADKISKYYKFLSLTLYTTLLFNPYNYIFAPYLTSYSIILNNLNWITNLLGQPLIFFKLKQNEKNSSMNAKKVYLLKNGHQILIITEDNSVSLINIKDISNYEEFDHYDKIFLKTFDKIFMVDIKNLKEYNEDIFQALKMRRIVNTQSSYSNYNRLTVQK